MGKLNQNLTTWVGKYRKIEFLVEDVSDLEGCTAEWAMAVTEGGEALINKSSETSEVGIELDGKYATVILEPEDTEDLEAGAYYHELRIVDSDGHPSTPAIGTITLKPVSLTGGA